MDPMEAIRATFFQECDELLADLETGLLAMQDGVGDDETVNAVFRAVHSVKGGAGAFGLESLVRFAHVFETTLDGVRNGAVVADRSVIQLLLRSADRLADHVNAAKLAQDLGEADDVELIAALGAVCGAAADADPADDGFDFTPQALNLDAPDAPPASSPNPGWTVRFKPHPALYESANDPYRLLRELGRLGPMDVSAETAGVPNLTDIDPLGAYLVWNATLFAPMAAEQDILDVFEFVEGLCDLDIAPLIASAPPRLATEAVLDPDPPSASRTAPLQAEAPADVAPLLETGRDDQGGARAGGEPLVQTTIRVDLERVDRLIDLVGELVINQAMLAQRVVEAGLTRSSTIALGLDDLEQLTREIQDSVMAIRAQPVKSVFQRMPRLIREVGAMTGKQVRLVTDGEGTEVDKTVVERLAEPLTHMIRNAIDHGLETPEERIAAGKPEEGVIRLSALHRSGRIVIEVADDGRGINRAKVRQVAVDRGVIDADAVLTDEETDNLIFAPGFSTADAISDISGRGVGMDVVKRSIQALGGRIAIASTPGKGSTFTLSLPLTLAVLDGMVVTVGAQTLVVPITVIVETLQPKAADVRALGPAGAVIAVRGSHVPLIDVGSTLGWRGDGSAGVTLLVESELGGLAALRVDAIQGQRQVVIKSLEQNYAPVEGIAAATILGDGRVALILDVDALISRRRRVPTSRVALSQAS